MDLSISQGFANEVDALVPAHAGGVDLSWQIMVSKVLRVVPAHAGGVDLSHDPI